MSDGLDPVIKVAAVAATAGGVGRILLALHGGERRCVVLAIEGGLGGLLGVIVAGIATYWDHGLRDAGWPLLAVAGVAGLAGAIGTRGLDIVVAAVQRRV